MPTESTASAAAAHEPMQAFAQVELGGIVVGIPAASVLRAMRRPAQLARLPRGSQAIDGVFTDGGRVVPLVDLRRWMDPAAGGEPPHVIVLGAQGRTIGLAVDAIRGLVRLPGSRIRKVHHDEAPDGFFHSVGTLDDGVSLISLLDPLQLMTQVQAWTQQDERAPEAEAEGGSGDAQQAHANAPLFALLRIHGSIVAVPALDVDEVVHKPLVQALDLGASQVKGIMQWRAAQVPVLAGGAAIGLSEPGDARPAAIMLVLSDGARRVALPADAVVTVRAIDPQTIQPCAEAGLARSGFFSGLARGADGDTTLMLDTAALLSAFAVRGLGEHAAQDLQAEDARLEPHIAFDIGQDWAIAMRSVLEIVSVPGDLAPVADAAEGVIGNLDWRGRTLPVLDVRRGAPVRSDARERLMVVQHKAGTAALLVNDLVALLPQQAGSDSQFTLAGQERVRMITVGQAAARKSFRLMELDALPFFAAGAA